MGFTLIELLTVIAIIGILAAIIIPTVGTVREKAQRAVDANNLREIAKAAMIYAGDNNDRLPDPQNIANATLTAPQRVLLWPGIIAKNGILTDPTFYFSKNDPQFNGTPPAAIINTRVAARNQLDPTFVGSVLSWEFVGGGKMSDPATTPIAFTRGLQTNGVWSVTSGVYKDTGGYIAFVGGNVVFYPNTNTPEPGVFTSNGQGVAKTQNILQAIPLGTTAAQNARIYGTPPAGGGGAILGSANGTVATRGP